jgi:uncharacterized protein with HEPN domain
MELHDIPKCLVDIRTSIDAIEGFLSRVMGDRRDFKLYRQDVFLRSAVERKLEIIGEATSRILKTDPSFKLTNARKIIDLRNRVIHSYDKIDDETIWYIITRHLPSLRKEVDRLLG